MWDTRQCFHHVFSPTCCRLPARYRCMPATYVRWTKGLSRSDQAQEEGVGRSGNPWRNSVTDATFGTALSIFGGRGRMGIDGTLLDLIDRANNG